MLRIYPLLFATKMMKHRPLIYLRILAQNYFKRGISRIWNAYENCRGCQSESRVKCKKAGIKSDDVLISVNNEEVTYFDEIQKSLYENKGKKVQIGVLRKNSSGNWNIIIGCESG